MDSLQSVFVERQIAWRLFMGIGRYAYVLELIVGYASSGIIYHLNMPLCSMYLRTVALYDSVRVELCMSFEWQV